MSRTGLNGRSFALPVANNAAARLFEIEQGLHEVEFTDRFEFPTIGTVNDGTPLATDSWGQTEFRLPTLALELDLCFYTSHLTSEAYPRTYFHLTSKPLYK